MSTSYAEGGIPKTIEELKDYCERNGFTESKTRFFIGYNYEGPKAFGIYKDEATGEFVVYKNKADGTRAVRYKGKDEEFAVVELYDRLQSEITNQKLQYAADMAERERNKYEVGDGRRFLNSFSRMDEYESSGFSNFTPDNNDSFKVDNDRTFGRGGYDRNDSREYNPLGIIIGIIAIILSLLLGGGGGYHGGSSGRSSYGGYDRYDSHWDSGSHSDWDSGNWDSGYTDWDSDW
ncbi:hypothetical protein [Butyrivibrio sp. INlla21]|uniref:hypothetical protein n=1 Tax=Butyrivibrio sp. INlla21 TaxID=1520811 RepID=UPI0008ED1B23|nr:hypothetical protein [Butyrivibrio sp. INlla21]SFU91963.1 hypothetical protein SAMN02910342_02381 [Butyrivibrio sp. INlla21]